MSSATRALGPAAKPEADSDEARLLHALERIERSRALLRAALLPMLGRDHEHGDPSASHGGTRTLRRWRARLRRWMAGTPLAPLVHPVSAAVRGWWQHHPWRTTGAAAGHAVSRELGPLVRRHPVLAVGVAAALGAALVAARPWRWQALAREAQIAGRRALHSSVDWVWHQLSQPAVQMALASALAAWSERHLAPAAGAQDPDPSDAAADGATQPPPHPGPVPGVAEAPVH